MFTIRGFDTDVYWNGLKLQELYYLAPQLDPYMMERIEVLKGPTSVLYGQSPTGGMVNMVSKRPLALPLHEVGIEAGTNSSEEPRVGTESVSQCSSRWLPYH